MKRWAGALLFILLLIETIIKANQGILSELLWACYPATLLLAIGLLFDIDLLSATGFLFHVCIGLPADLLYLSGNGNNNWASFLIHVLSPIIGLWAWQGKQLPFASTIIATSMVIISVAIAYLFTAPELNINQAFKPWNPINLGFWGSRIFNAQLIFSLLLIGRMGINRCLKKP